MVRKQFMGLGLAALLAMTGAVPALADTYDEIAYAQAEKDAAEYALENTRDRIYTLSEEREGLRSYLDELGQQITDLSTELDTISEEIKEKAADIKTAQAAVKRAKLNERRQ